MEHNGWKHGWGVLLSFTIVLHHKDKAVLNKIKKSLGVGNISRQGSQTLQLKVQSLNEIERVIKHFNKYQLIT